MLEFRDKYSWNTIPLQIKCSLLLEKFQLCLIAETKCLETAMSRLNVLHCWDPYLCAVL